MLEGEHGGEQDVVLLVDVEVRVGFQLREGGVEGPVAGASVGGHRVAVGRGPQLGEEVAGAVVLEQHHPDRVGEGAAVERRCDVGGVELADHGEQHALLLGEVGFEVGSDRGHEVGDVVSSGWRVAWTPATLAARASRRGSSSWRYRWWVASRWSTSAVGRHRGPVGSSRGGCLLELVEDDSGVEPVGGARVGEGLAAAAAVVQVVSFEGPGGAGVGGDDVGEGRVELHGWLLLGEVDAEGGGGDDEGTEGALADAEDLGGDRGAGGDALQDDHGRDRGGAGEEGRVDGYAGGRETEGGGIGEDQQLVARWAGGGAGRSGRARGGWR